MQPRQRRVHRVEHRRAFLSVRARHVRHPDHPAFDETHHVECGAGDALVGAIDDRLCDRKPLRMKRADRLELAVDRMRGRQELAGRLAPEHVFARRRLQHVGRVRLTALELLDAQRSLEALGVGREIGLEPRHIETQRRGDVLGAGIGRLAVECGHGLPPARKLAGSAAMARVTAMRKTSRARLPDSRYRGGKIPPASRSCRPPRRRVPAPRRPICPCRTR
jgi:hypothetical protein